MRTSSTPEKSYADALKAYETLQPTTRFPLRAKTRSPTASPSSLGKTQQWDRALAQSLDFVKTHRGTVWEPRGLYWLGRLYLGVPHQGYRVGPRVYRGNDVPKQPASDAAPERVDLSAQDARNAHDALEAARVLFGAYRDREADARRGDPARLRPGARAEPIAGPCPLGAETHAWDKPDVACLADRHLRRTTTRNGPLRSG